MKKIFTLFAAAMMTLSMSAASYGILVNSKMYYQAEALGEKDYQDRDQYKVSVTLAQGDKWCVYDAENNASFTIPMEQGDGSAIGNFSEGAEYATCNVAGCYDFYIKLKWEDNSLWVQNGSNCNATGVDITGDTPVTPPVTPSGDAYWYWKGDVDGVPIQNEIDGGLFDCGISEITVTSQAYIFVMYQQKGVAGVQYMTDGWKGTDLTHVTMMPSGNDKLYIPAGTYTLYLYDNGDGTVELSREQLAGKKLMDCDSQGFETIKATEKARKTIINGELRIVRGDKIFDVTGRKL